MGDSIDPYRYNTYIGGHIDNVHRPGYRFLSFSNREFRTAQEQQNPNVQKQQQQQSLTTGNYEDRQTEDEPDTIDLSNSFEDMSVFFENSDSSDSDFGEEGQRKGKGKKSYKIIARFQNTEYNNSWPNTTIRLMCWAHVFRNYKDKLRGLPTEIVDAVKDDIRMLQYARNPEEFETGQEILDKFYHLKEFKPDNS